MATPVATPTRLSPYVQQMQQCSPYTDIYTNAPITPLRSRKNTQHLLHMVPHAHPEPKRWESPGGWGARHINDIAPFTLWDEQSRRFLSPTREQSAWIKRKFGTGSFSMWGWFICIETARPPQPIPLTLGTMPVIYVRPGEMFEDTIPESGYSNPRVPDPCPALRWPKMTHPTKNQRVAILTAVAPLANIRTVYFMPIWTIFELQTGDSCIYQRNSLPGVVAGRTALYHHADIPFHHSLRSLTRDRQIDPSQAPLQDDSNYLRRSVLTPGCRVESGFGPPGSRNQLVNAATAAGIKIRNIRSGEEALTVAHHGFLSSKEVYHPRVSGDLVGEVVDIRPELDISLVRLIPVASYSFKNSCYFQAQAPTHILEGRQIIQGSWSEVDGMSSGLFSLMSCGVKDMAPIRPIGHPDIPFEKWTTRSMDFIFGNVNNAISDGVCGAPIVDIDTGGVAGFFHLTNGTYSFSARLDDLVAEGWRLV
ncbi:hypothetical protein N7495_009052 [Penicillium taxi]|uniref:uncharacterized protein n=1 Tax=Penicillium taxi TaxID=168475 RepID=UPI0025454F8A|nr:uncharacterized protein N7495_009052 [Penicillium taxi]KAJ5889011.1 hypothetical protein N7495_009052 [Penicillium taxi]